MPAGDRANAQTLVEQVCEDCHTTSGIGSESGERESERMQLVANAVSDKDMTDLAQYFAAPAALASPNVADYATAEEIARGGTIAIAGLPDKGMPSCLTCHSASKTSDLPIIARLHGQAPRYIETRLQTLGSITSEDLYSLSPMHGIAKNMNEQDRHDVAAWFATQDPLPK